MWFPKLCLERLPSARLANLNIRGVGMSRLVPLLVAEVQALRKRLAAFKIAVDNFVQSMEMRSGLYSITFRPPARFSSSKSMNFSTLSKGIPSKAV